MNYISSLSGGSASAVATDRAIQRYGREAVHIWIADTLYEDDDLWRFVSDCMIRWGGELYRHSEGKTPLQVSEDRKMIFNQKIAPCSEVLKIKPFTRLVKHFPKPVTVLLGLDWAEQHRMERPKQKYEEIPGVTVDYPLMWKPYDFDIFKTIRDWGIEIPRMYQMGFPHNNCGGRCFRQGINEWLRLRVYFPERFEQVREWEAAQQAKGDARANYAICRDQSGGKVHPLSLLDIEQRELQQSKSTVQEDMFACFCSY